MKKTILIVDDEPMNIRLLATVLQPNFRCIFCMESSDVLMTAQNEMPELILLDVMMPHLNGYEVAEILKNNRETKNIPIIFVSALSSPEDLEKAKNCGGSDYMTKPVDINSLLNKVQYYIL